jgi:hypothetical protein
MSGHATAKRLSSYLDDQLDEHESRQIAAHLGRCARCRGQLEGLQRVIGHLRALEQSKPPEGLGLRLQQRLAREAPPMIGKGALGHRFPRPFFQPAILGSLGVVIALGVLMILFIQQLEREVGDGTLFGIDPGDTAVESGPVEIGARTFQLMGGIWVESDLTVAEVAGARVIDRDTLLGLEGLPEGTQEILNRFDRHVTLRVAGEVLRVRPSGARQ